MNKIQSSLILLLTASIWGIAFVAQSVGMDYVGPFTFNAVRSIIGGIVLIPCIFFLNKLSEKEKKYDSSKEKNLLLTGGICCGIFLCAASNFQQIGIKYTTVGKAGFITACYIILVPILGIFLGKKTGKMIWLSVVLAVIGLYLLCISGSFSIGKGDFFVLCCAFLFAVHILIIDYFAPKTDGVKLSCIQFLVSGILSSIFMFLFENPTLFALLQAWKPLLYAGVMSCGVAYTLQIIGQKNMNPTVASLILSLESCISVLAGWVLLHQKLSLREILGCVIMFIAILIAQLPEKN
ncbi:MAG: DMT family transporter [Lachnospiraceae bacterium]